MTQHYIERNVHIIALSYYINYKVNKLSLTALILVFNQHKI